MCNCNKPELGDKIEKGLEALGAKSCDSCKKRKNEINVVSSTFSRRGFVAGLIAIPFAVKNMAILAAQSLVNATPALEEWAVLGFMRTYNGAQIQSLVNNGVSLEGADALIKVAGHREHFDESKSGYKWMSVFTPGGKHVLPGWQHAHKQPSNTEFLFVMAGPGITFITDENGIIFRAPAGPIDLTGVNKAMDYPGAIAFGVDDDVQLSMWQKIKRQVTTVTYANGPAPAPCPPCGQNGACCKAGGCYSNCGRGSMCSGCILACDVCTSSACRSSRPPTGCAFNTGCGNCTWYASGEVSGCYGCQACADVYGTCCFCIGIACNN